MYKYKIVYKENMYHIYERKFLIWRLWLKRACYEGARNDIEYLIDSKRKPYADYFDAWGIFQEGDIGANKS